MRDVDDRQPLLAQAADNGEKALHLGPAQGGGRLIHDQDAGIVAQGFGVLHQLRLMRAEFLDRSERVDFQAHPVQAAPGLLHHGAGIQEKPGLDG
ncbi:MAG: hypothetical protein IT210_00825 [Armatimonadetes bacterium]|nr:hypothetical protein [Armatimonadota bacterium]